MPAHIVIVGGGYAGSLIATALDDVADVTLVDPRDAFLNVSASLRALTQPAWAHNAFFPYRGLLARGRHVRASAISADASGVQLSTGEHLAADHLVLATGSVYPFPAHPRGSGSGTEQSLADLRTAYGELERAARVLIVGAGPVGLELAGEIRAVWPDKGIVVVGRGSELLPGYLPEVRAALMRQLAELEIEVRLGTELVGEPDVPEGRLGRVAVSTTGGADIRTEIWFRAFGARPNTGFLGDGRLTELTPRGLVPVTATLNVVGHANVWAVGDIADLPDPKMATWAQEQAAVVVANLRRRLAGEPGEVTYSPMTSATRRIFLPLGPRAGVGQVPSPAGGPVAAPVEVVIDRKGRDLFTSRFAERFSRL